MKDDDCDNIQGIIYLGSDLTWDYAAVCGGITRLKILVRD